MKQAETGDGEQEQGGAVKFHDKEGQPSMRLSPANRIVPSAWFRKERFSRRRCRAQPAGRSHRTVTHLPSAASGASTIIA
jgi:hypothetical protein